MVPKLTREGDEPRSSQTLSFCGAWLAWLVRSEIRSYDRVHVGAEAI